MGRGQRLIGGGGVGSGPGAQWSPDKNKGPNSGAGPLTSLFDIHPKALSPNGGPSAEVEAEDGGGAQPQEK